MTLAAALAVAACDTDADPDGQEVVVPDEQSRDFFYRPESPVLGRDLLGLGVKRAFVAGGRQTMTLDRVYEPTGEDEPVLQPFDVEIDEDGWEVLDVAPPAFQIRAGRGEASLRLLDLPAPTAGEPSDTALRSADIASIRGGAYLEWRHSRAWAFLVGGPRALYVELLDAAGAPLVDEDLELAAQEGGRRLAWDVVEVSSDAVGETGLTVTASDGIARTLSVQWVDAIDEVFAIETPITTSVGETFEACFAGRAGDTIVHGLEWSFEGSGPFVVTYVPTPTPGTTGRHCATGEGTSVGQGTLTARAAGREVTVEVLVDPEDQG